MKKTIITGLLLFLLVSCETQFDKIDLPEELYDCKNHNDIRNWLIENIKYVKDMDNYGGREYWAAPEETLEKRKGDCEDFAILYGYLCKVLLNKNIFVIIARSYCDCAEGHAFNKINGRYKDPQGGRLDEFLTNDYYLIEYNFDFIYSLVKNNRG